jgi:hypothetical protein
MPYIGRDTDKISNVEVLDNITFDGSSSYTLQKGGSNFTPSSANTLLLSIDGVVQAGNFTVSGSTIDFGTAVAGTSTCDFVLHYGVGLITAPSDGTVTTAKLADSSVSLAKLTATGTKSSSTFLRGDNTFAEAGGGNTVAISHVQDTANYTQSNQGETVFGSGLTFTPASTTSQVVAFIEVHVAVGNDGSDNDARTLFRFYSINSSGNGIKELDTFAEFGHVNMLASSHTMYGYFTSVISNCQRDSSNNVVIKITGVSNQDPGTTVYVENQRAVFMEIG